MNAGTIKTCVMREMEKWRSGNDFPVAFSFRCISNGEAGGEKKNRKLAKPGDIIEEAGKRIRPKRRDSARFFSLIKRLSSGIEMII